MILSYPALLINVVQTCAMVSAVSELEFENNFC